MTTSHRAVTHASREVHGAAHAASGYTQDLDFDRMKEKWEEADYSHKVVAQSLSVSYGSKVTLQATDLDKFG